MTFSEETKIAQEKCLNQCLGNIFDQVPKQVIGITKCPEDGGILYLCTWHQNFEDNYFVPSWVQSHILAEIVGLQLITDYYES